MVLNQGTGLLAAFDLYFCIRSFSLLLHTFFVCVCMHFCRSLPLPEDAGRKREAEMSRMVTLVPPCNPFNTIEKEEVVAA